MANTFQCADCDSVVSFNSSTIESMAYHAVQCPHCGATNYDQQIDSLGNITGHRYRRKVNENGEETSTIIRNEPVEDVKNTLNNEITCSSCNKPVTFSPTKISSTIVHSVRCPKCGTENANEVVDNAGKTLGSRFIVVNNSGKLISSK